MERWSESAKLAASKCDAVVSTRSGLRCSSRWSGSGNPPCVLFSMSARRARHRCSWLAGFRRPEPPRGRRRVVARMDVPGGLPFSRGRTRQGGARAASVSRRCSSQDVVRPGTAGRARAAGAAACGAPADHPAATCGSPRPGGGTPRNSSRAHPRSAHRAGLIEEKAIESRYQCPRRRTVWVGIGQRCKGPIMARSPKGANP